jgi:hypothetical protein
MKKPYFIYYTERKTKGELVIFTILFLLILFFGFFDLHQAMLITCLFTIGFLLFIGYVNYLNNKISISLTDYHLQHHSNKGGWCLNWNNIETLGLPFICSNYIDHELDFIGIKIKNYSLFLNSICLKEANKLIVKNRRVLYLIIRTHDLGNENIANILYDDTPFQDENNQTITGSLALLANQMTVLRKYIDYDILISGDDFDKECADVLGLLRQGKASAKSL